MARDITIAMLPWMGVLAAAIFGCRLLLRFSGARLRLARLVELHRDQDGAVQSLAFVLAAPVFVMALMLIVQVGQLMIAVATVQYAAYAAGRSAVVWIAADAGGEERENRISSFYPSDVGIPGAGQGYTIRPGSPKYDKIEFAAQLACAAISPSRDAGQGGGGRNVESLRRVYRALDPENYDANPRIPQRLANKLAYSRANTEVEIRFLHKAGEPEIVRWDIPDDRDEFYYNEVGWQDPIEVTVIHHFALLPGPGRLLARSTGRGDTVTGSLGRRGKVYTRELAAKVVMTIEGEKSMVPYRHDLAD